MIDPRTPILVGAGQLTDTEGKPSSERSRVAFCTEAANAALSDTRASIGAEALGRKVDAVAVMEFFSDISPRFASPYGRFFYLLTGLHGLHILGGLVALARALPAAWRGGDPGKLRLRLELCVAYWHFLLFVWLCLLVLFTGWAADFVTICRALLT